GANDLTPADSFGTNGVVVTNFTDDGNGTLSDETAYRVAIDPNDKIVVAGSYLFFADLNTTTFTDFIVARYNSDGTLDDNSDLDGGFGDGGGGFVITDFGSDE